ncbi:MAG: capsule assembly Wzi family protein, partial [Treponema sp.]|nr:capsule assembly Wzi family protein [Treponema sp.]
MKRYFILVLLLSLIFAGVLSAQEALKSIEEDYYDFLALQGLTERPYLNYRTLSDSVWAIDEQAQHSWQGVNLGTRRHLFGDVFMRIYGPELFSSFNTAAPYGQNDGALWQGKGFNASLTGGVRFEGYGVELTFKPQLAFSQNLEFDIMKPEMSGTNYADKAALYGYFWGRVDAPQRFGDEPFFTYDWGDTEIRYTWKTLTIGFGTQAIWLGPTYLNPMLHSNNAPTYPKLDIGLRKQPVTIPWINWYAGDIEARMWVGYLSESAYFDNNSSNDHNMFHGLSLAYAPSFLSGLTLSVNRVCLVPWEWENLKYVIPLAENTIEDQKASFAFSWIFPQVGFEVFGELGIDDFIGGGVWQYIRNPFHTTIYTAGLKKTVNIVPKKQIYGKIIFESNWFEKTQDYQLTGYSFYFHHLITQGYTNGGQWLGSGIGSGGNSQYLAFDVYYPQGNTLFFITRNNPDQDYLDKDAAIKTARPYPYFSKANFVVGFYTNYFINSLFA